MNSEKMDSSGVDTGNDEVCSKVALVPEEVLLEEGHASDDAGFAASRERVEFELGGDEGGDEFGTGSGREGNVRLLCGVWGGGGRERSYSAAVPAPVQDCL